MDIYISNKKFYAKCFSGEKEISACIIPGLSYKIKKEEDNYVYLENVDSKSYIVVTHDMLYSSLFIKGE